MPVPLDNNQDVTEEMVRSHFSRYGQVTDVYFPRHKKTLKRRPFCFVSFADVASAAAAVEEGCLEICGVPIKNLTMVRAGRLPLQGAAPPTAAAAMGAAAVAVAAAIQKNVGNAAEKCDSAMTSSRVLASQQMLETGLGNAAQRPLVSGGLLL